MQVRILPQAPPSPGTRPPACMVRRLLLSLLVALTLGCAVPSPPPTPFAPSPRPDTPAIVAQVTWLVAWPDGRFCSATAVGAHTLLTARHCVDDDPTALGFAALADEDARVVETAHISDTLDLAVLKLADGAESFHAWAALGNADALVPGSFGWTAGYGCSRGRQLDVRPAYWLWRDATLDLDLVLVDAWRGRVCPGDSGGGTFDRRGRLVGVNHSHDGGTYFANPVFPR